MAKLLLNFRFFPIAGSFKFSVRYVEARGAPGKSVLQPNLDFVQPDPRSLASLFFFFVIDQKNCLKCAETHTV